MATALCVFSHIVVRQCIKYRLELTVGDALNEVSGINHYDLHGSTEQIVHSLPQIQTQSASYLQRIKYTVFTNV